ncbi:MAG: MBL fold metallo-hydrolase [Candidatus Saccharimonadales bacterium]
MDLQFYGADCVSLTYKGTRIVVDDNLVELGAKSVTRPGDVALFTDPGAGGDAGASGAPARLVFGGPGEYEVADVSITGIAVRAHVDESGKNATMFKLVVGDVSVLVTGHVYPELTDDELEAVGVVDLLVVPVGGNGYTVDPAGAMKLIKAIEPKLVVPTHYADKALKFPVPQQSLQDALKELTVETKETVSKLRLKHGDLSDVTQVVILEKS